MRPPFSVRTHVFGLILVTLLPLLAFSAFLVIRSAEHEQEILAAAVQDRTRAAARDIERELGNLRSQLFVVANAGRVCSRAISPRSTRAPPRRWGRAAWRLVLSQPDGKEVLDTRLPLDARAAGQPGPRGDPRRSRPAASSMSSDLTVSPVTTRPTS